MNSAYKKLRETLKLEKSAGILFVYRYVTLHVGNSINGTLVSAAPWKSYVFVQCSAFVVDTGLIHMYTFFPTRIAAGYTTRFSKFCSDSVILTWGHSKIKEEKHVTSPHVVCVLFLLPLS